MPANGSSDDPSVDSPLIGENFRKPEIFGHKSSGVRKQAPKIVTIAGGHKSKRNGWLMNHRASQDLKKSLVSQNSTALMPKQSPRPKGMVPCQLIGSQKSSMVSLFSASIGYSKSKQIVKMNPSQYIAPKNTNSDKPKGASVRSQLV